MTDKEVGELWQKILRQPDDNHGDVYDLIVKLVEERAWSVARTYYRDNLVERKEMLSCVKAACRDFDIDPATWPNA